MEQGSNGTRSRMEQWELGKEINCGSTNGKSGASRAE